MTSRYTASAHSLIRAAIRCIHAGHLHTLARAHTHRVHSFAGAQRRVGVLPSQVAVLKNQLNVHKMHDRQDIYDASGTRVVATVRKANLFQCASDALVDIDGALGLGSSLPHLRRDWAHPCHICAGTGLSPATSALRLGSALPHLHWDWALCTQPCRIRAGTGLSPATSAPGPGSMPHSH
jgi:hypothetical protein